MSTAIGSLATTELFQAGQSPWLDSISREILKSGRLQSWIADYGVMGVTSNPTIFEKAFGQAGGGYDEDIRRMFSSGMSTFEVYDALTLADIRRTCDLFLPVYQRTQGEHGFVSLEVAPNLAHDERGTLAEAGRLFKAVNRPNIMIKIPATPEGIPAIRACLSEGININVTLMFSMKHYREVAGAYLEGLAGRRAKGGDLRRLHSVASIFVSRIDTLLDKKLDDLGAKFPDQKERCRSLKGKAAVANSKLIYQAFKEIFNSEAFKKLRAAGAKVQKALWGSTSAKNPAYSDLIYVENLVGAETVNTMPQNTLEALLDHGIIRRDTIEEGLAESEAVLSELEKLGIDLLETGETLQREGVKAFNDSFDALMRTLELKRVPRGNRKKKFSKISASYSLASKSAEEVRERAGNLQSKNFHARFFQRDPSLWKQDIPSQEAIKNRLGWLNIQDWMLGRLYEIDILRKQLEDEKIKSIVLLGMGGSSLAPEVIGRICGRSSKGIQFYVLDTTDPGAILNVEKKLNLKSAVFIVSSKSGSTIETLSQFRYFYSRVETAYGKKAREKAGRHFIAITDEGSSLEKLAGSKQFRRIFINPKDVGGRFSALSYFGMAPAGLIGIDVRPILNQARDFLSWTREESRIEKNQAIYLGVTLAWLAKKGQDKVTLWISPAIRSFGTWLEQLVAESTGKEGKGIVPVEGEDPLDWKAYGKDRVFIAIQLKGDKAGTLPRRLREVKKAGYPVIEIEWPNQAAVGQAFLQWEIATAVMGAELEMNPFDEPNVKESKENTAVLLEKFKKNKKFDESSSILKAAGEAPFDSFFSRSQTGGYIALLAYTGRSKELARIFNNIRLRLAAHFKVPVLLGFGPRYLHSIGQLYKGGPKNGLFIEFLTQEAKDLKIPGEIYSFGQLKRAQALGDKQALEDKGLAVLTLDLGKDWLAALKRFETKLASYLKDRQ